MDSDVRPLLNHGARNGTGLYRSGLTSAEYHGMVASLDLYSILLLIWPKIALVFLVLSMLTHTETVVNSYPSVPMLYYEASSSLFCTYIID